MVFELLRNRGLIIPVCVSYVFFVSPTTLSLSGLLQLSVRRWRQGHGALLWLLAQLEIEAHPLSLFFLFSAASATDVEFFLSVCGSFSFAKRRRRRSCEPAELFLIAREEENFFFGPFFSWSMNGMEWRKELLLLLHFLLFFHLLPTRLFFFFISFFFIYSPSSSCNVKSHGSLHTHTHRVDGYGTH